MLIEIRNWGQPRQERHNDIAARKKTNKAPGILLVALVSLAGSGIGASAQEAPNAGAPNYALNSEQCFRDWLKNENKHDGKNDLPDGSFLLIASGDAQVNEDKQNPEKWLAARRAAFSQAELKARENIAIFLRNELKAGGRSFEAAINGGEDLPPVVKNAATQLSVADKALTLTGASLDAEIKKFKPDWDGTGRTEDQRRQEIVKVQTHLREQIEQFTRVLISGAITAVQCEGPNSDGRYSVMTGTMWSFKLAQIAQSVTNPSFTLPPNKPQISLQERFEQLNKDKPDWMALTEGVRVWTDESGKRVIVGFGTVPATSQASIDASRARTRAFAAIQYFVAEQVESNNSDNVDFGYRETSTGAQSFDNSTYEQKIRSRAQAMTIQGGETLTPWRLNHPWSNARMTTVAVKWSADGARGAVAAEQEMKRTGEHISGAPNGSGAEKPGSAVRSGASSSTDDF